MTAAEKITFNGIKDYLRQFCGTEQYWKRSIFGRETGFVYTDGVKAFCEKAEAQWFIDNMNSYMSKINKVNDAFFSVSIQVNEKQEAMLLITHEVYSQMDRKPEDRIVIRQKIPYTDLPVTGEDKYKFFLALSNIREDGLKEYCLMVPSEY